MTAAMLGLQDAAAGEVALPLDVRLRLRRRKRSTLISTAFYSFDFGLDWCLAFSFGRRPRFDVQLRVGLTVFRQPLPLVGDPARQLIAGRLVLVPTGRLGCFQPVIYLGLRLGLTPRYVRVAHRLVLGRIVLGRIALLFLPSAANKPDFAKPALTAGTHANSAAKL